MYAFARPKYRSNSRQDQYRARKCLHQCRRFQLQFHKQKNWRFCQAEPSFANSLNRSSSQSFALGYMILGQYPLACKRDCVVRNERWNYVPCRSLMTRRAAGYAHTPSRLCHHNLSNAKAGNGSFPTMRRINLSPGFSNRHSTGRIPSSGSQRHIHRLRSQTTEKRS